jgi:HD-like signal output (HDOD) protein
MTKPVSLKEWIRRINEEEMPVFAHTARRIAAASKGLDTPLAELAHLILQDSAMTARVLRLANSAYYNPSGKAVNTISRAILFLGFDVVRSIALTIAIIDPMLKGLQHDYVIREMARSFHAAVQAKAIAQVRGVTDIEEVFIAALLYRLGHMAFWCFPFGFATRLDSAYQAWDIPEDAEIDVLGFSLRQLTQALNDEWHLSELLAKTLRALDKTSQTQDLHQAYELVHAVEEGWGSLATQRATRAIADRIELTLEETVAMIHKNAFEAVQVTREFGIEIAGKHIPLPEKLPGTLEQSAQAKTTTQSELQLQLSILRELTTMLHEKVDINAIIGTVLEGVSRALSMERTVIAFIAADDGHLKAKYLLGDDKGKFKRCFDFPIGYQHNDFLAHILNQKEGCWVNNKTRARLDPLMSQGLRQCLGVMDFFILPLRVSSKGIGVVYADCKFSGRPLTETEFQTFVHFSEHINIAFELAAKQK